MNQQITQHSQLINFQKIIVKNLYSNTFLSLFLVFKYLLLHFSPMDIKHYLEAYFQKPQINSIILSYITKKNLKYQNLSNDQLMTMLEDLQLLDPLLEQMNNNENVNSLNQQHGQMVEQVSALNQETLQLDSYEYGYGKKSTISFNIKSGRKFKDFPKLQASTKFFVSVVGFNHKAKTQLHSTSESFAIGQTLKFTAYEQDLKTDRNCPFELSIVLLNPQTGESRLYTVKLIEWRYLLCYGSVSFDIELAPYFHQGTHEMEPVGILSLELKLYPISKLNIVTQNAVQNQIQLEKKMKQKKNNEFYKTASQFWNDYKSIHSSFATRRVKLYASSQDKIYVPLPKLITPLYNLKGIESPNHALRFCSLIEFEQDQLNQSAIHKRYSSTLSNKRGNTDDHCHLLCGMLLGFGLKAYVIVGHAVEGQHSWVMTVAKDSLTFWECTKGQKFDYFSPKTFKFYKSVHMVYNHQEYYANIQLDDSISGTKFDFQNRNMWKSLNSDLIAQLPNYNRQLALLPPSLDIYKIQSSLQNSLKIKISEYRKKNKLSSTNFDPIINSILTTALTNYEWQRISGTVFCEQEFQTAIRGYIPVNHSFKAFPIHLTTLGIDQIMDQLAGQQKCRDILLSKGDSIFFGLRCKVVAFPDNVFALWVSVAVRFFKLQN